jgi:protein-S-isoprenylcysteine O-methyltransferase Ste14
MLGLNLPLHVLAAAVLLGLYTLQSELRFGARARAMRPGSADRGSSLVLSAAQLIPLFGLVFVVKGLLPNQLEIHLPGMPATAWLGISIGGFGLLLRFWAVLKLRERYTRTLQVYEGHHIERSGPYRVVRHPGYLGSLLTLNGIALASGNAAVSALSVMATISAYIYRIRVEEEMLVASLGTSYKSYQSDVPALIPFIR